MPWYQPCATRGYSKFYDSPAGVDAQGAPTGDLDRAVQYEVSDQYLGALERAYHQGQFDAGITNVEDTSAYVLDHLAENCIVDTEGAYRLGRASVDQDPGGSVDPNYTNPATNTPGSIPQTPDMSVVYGTGATPSGQPAQPSGGGTTPYSPQPADGTAGPSPLFGSFSGGFVPTSAGGFPLPPGVQGTPRTSINWLLILAVAAGAWFLLKGDRS